jgi:hypothetical protein
MAGATAVAFSLDAVFLKSTGLSVRADDDLVRVAALGAGFVVCAGLGNLLVQRSFQLGPLSASLPVVTAGQPVCGALLGALLFAERPDGVAAALALVVGLVLVAGGAFTAVRAGTPGPAGAAAAAAHEDAEVPAAEPAAAHPAAAARPAFDPVAPSGGVAQVALGSGGADRVPPARPSRSPSVRRNSA